MRSPHLQCCTAWAAGDLVPLPALSVVTAVRGWFGRRGQRGFQTQQGACWRSRRAATEVGGKVLAENAWK